MSTNSSLSRLTYSFQKFSAALEAWAALPPWTDEADAVEGCRAAYWQLCGLAGELGLPSVPALAFPPKDAASGRIGGEDLARWASDAFGRLRARGSGNGNVGAVPPRRKTGRPRKTDKDSAAKVVAALRAWHEYQEDGSVGNYEPASNRELADRYGKGGSGLAPNALSRFLKDKLGKDGDGHKNYTIACRNKSIGAMLTLWLGELPSRLLDLLPSEYGRGEDDDD